MSSAVQQPAVQQPVFAGTRLASTRLAGTRLAITRLASTRLAITRLAITALPDKSSARSPEALLVHRVGSWGSGRPNAPLIMLSKIDGASAR